MRPLNMGYEVLFIDDGSKDKSLKVIKDIVRQDKRFRYFSFQKNYGKSAALQVGFRNATGDVVITMDADLQDDPNEIGNLLKKLQDGYDLVSGWKKVRHDPFIKKHSSRFFNYITRLMSGIKIHDFNCGLKAYRKEVTDTLKVYGELHRYLPVLAKWNGFTVSEVPVKHHPRRYGKTKFGISRFFKGFIDLLTVMFSTRYIKRPMHFFGFFGAIAFIIGIIVNGYLTYLWASGQPLSNRPMLFLGMLLIIVGIQFFSVGLLGEMVVHNTLDEKEYIIRDKG
jgi:glycosyltransferase involved in cell wall biosynthesis